MVKAWVADISPLYEESCYELNYRSVPLFRRQKADRIKTAKGRAQSVGVWVLWEEMRKHYRLTEDAPFNLSHSGDFVMCAARTDGGRAEVGCDIERVRKVRPELAERYFCREEAEDMRRAEAGERDSLFCRYWVLKESFMKATRKGMALPLDSFCVRLSEPPVLVRKPEEFDQSYYYREYILDGMPYRMAVCSTDSEIDGEVHLIRSIMIHKEEER